MNLSNEGLTKFFSPIEARLMEVLWTNEKVVMPEISEKTGIPLSNVAEILDRLVKAGFAKKSHQYTFFRSLKGLSPEQTQAKTSLFRI
jgi:DNA-binding MarR family transcriptional regulator